MREVDDKGCYVGNTTVKCNVTCVLSWFPHANMTPTFDTTPVWFENPVPLNQECDNITMTVLTLFFFGDKTYPIADSYWMCGEDELVNTLPYQWFGLCTLVRMKVPVTAVYEGVNELIKMDNTHRRSHRRIRQYTVDSNVHLDIIGQP